MAKDAVAAGGGGEERFEDRGDLCALGGEVDEEAVAVLRGGRLGGKEGWKRRRFAVRAIGVERCESGGAGGFGGHDGGEMGQGAWPRRARAWFATFRSAASSRTGGWPSVKGGKAGRCAGGSEKPVPRATRGILPPAASRAAGANSATRRSGARSEKRPCHARRRNSRTPESARPASARMSPKL